jgi:serine/threonine protein kinase
MTAAGTRFGPYEIVEPIGAGGMGAVYRAKDTELGRDVAIKLLPESFVGDVDRLARLEREAKTLASLNHYNVAQIYGIERTSAGTALILELVEGPTLADRIANGPLPLNEACDIARQIAVALGAAHERGIVHRDLKPANVKIRPDGVVKVLDFGIAKVLETHPAVAERNAGPPATAARTEIGQILGTTAYMSPEQARGRPLDRRADIWAFGVVLYEMLTGRRPFAGEDVTDVVAAVLTAEPDFGALPALPPQLQAFLRQCLEKDPARRVHDIADVRLAIEGAYRWPTSAEHTAGRDDDRPDLARRRSFMGLGWLASGTLGLVAGSAGTQLLAGSAGRSQPPTYRQLTFRNGSISGARFQSDGENIVYGAAWDDEPFRIHTTRLSSYQSNVRADLTASLLALSRSGVAALSLDHATGSGFRPRGVLARVDLAGGAPRPLADDIVAADFDASGEIAAVLRHEGSVQVLEFPPGVAVVRESVISQLRISPDGNRVCFAANYDALMIAERGGEARTIAEGLPRIASCAWSPDGREIWFAYAPGNGTISSVEAIRPDGSGRRTLLTSPSWLTLYDVAGNGDLLVSSGSIRYSAHGARSPEARARDLAPFDASRVTYLAGSGDQVVLRDNSAESAQSGSNVYTRPIDGGAATAYEGRMNAICLSSGRQWLAILGTVEESGTASNRISLVPTGPGEPRVVDLGITFEYATGNNYGTNDWRYRCPDFSLDDRRLLLPFGRGPDDGAPRVYVYDFDEQRAIAVTPEGVAGPVVLSPDGRFVASNEAEGLVLYTVGSSDRRLAPGGRDPGRLARWGFDQDYVFLLEPRATGAGVYRRSLVTGLREHLHDVDVPDPAGVTRFDLWIARDGQGYAYTLDRILSNLFLVRGIG